MPCIKTTLLSLSLLAAAVTNTQAQYGSSSPKAPAGGVLLLTAHASGYQVYGCEANGDWSKSEPVAALVTGKGEIIRHYRDKFPVAPTWEASDGSKVHALLVDGKPDQSLDSSTPDSIPQLGLKTTPGDGKGLLGAVTYVIRRKTEGGNHPPGACKLDVGTRVTTFYQADYDFYTNVK